VVEKWSTTIRVKTAMALRYATFRVQLESLCRNRWLHRRQWSEISQIYWRTADYTVRRRRRFPQTTKLNHSATDRASAVAYHPGCSGQTDRRTDNDTQRRAQGDTINASKTVPRRQLSMHVTTVEIPYVARTAPRRVVILRSIWHVTRPAWQKRSALLCHCGHSEKKPRLELH